VGEAVGAKVGATVPQDFTVMGLAFHLHPLLAVVCPEKIALELQNTQNLLHEVANWQSEYIGPLTLKQSQG
jgi:hypothetical protein